MSGEYCEECSIEVLGFNCADLADRISESKVEDGLGVRAYCEECGDIYVDHMGKRIAYAYQVINQEDLNHEGTSQSIGS